MPHSSLQCLHFIIKWQNLEEVRKILKRERRGYRNVPTLSTSRYFAGLAHLSESESIKRVTDLSAAIFSRLLRALCTFRFGGRWPPPLGYIQAAESMMMNAFCRLDSETSNHFAFPWIILLKLLHEMRSEIILGGVSVCEQQMFQHCKYYPIPLSCRSREEKVPNFIEKFFFVNCGSITSWPTPTDDDDLPQRVWISFFAAFFLIVCFEASDSLWR